MYQKIKYFLKAAETGSFSTAAREMFISSQALTKQISVLEKDLGGKLFDRSPQGVRLTAFGQHAFHQMETVTREFDTAIEELQEYAKNEGRRLSIGIFSALPKEELITPLVSFLLASYPDYQIRLEMIELEEGWEKIKNGKIDLLITNVHEQEDLSDYQCLSFEEYDAKIVVSLTHPWIMKESISFEDMKKETFLKLSLDEDHYRVPLPDNFYYNVPCKQMRLVSNYDTLLVLLSQGAGFALIPMAFADMDRAKIKSFDYPGKTLRHNTVLVCRKETDFKGLDKIVGDIADEFDLKQI